MNVSISIKSIWTDDSIKKRFEDLVEKTIPITTRLYQCNSIRYFEDLDRILDPNYVPTNRGFYYY